MKPFSWLSKSTSGLEKSQISRNAQTLENMSASVMMADKDRIIVFANKAVRTLLKGLESEIRETLPNFSADNLVGQSIDQFYADPAHQERILANLQEESVTEITLGKINFKLTLVPLFDEQGQKTGSSVEWVDVSEQLVNQGKLEAINRSQAAIEFNLDGTIRFANENFLGAMGYSLEEVQGKHHSIFVDAEYKNSAEYKQFWEKLNRGEFETGEFKRFNKNGDEVWIQASYNPVLDAKGNPIAVVKYATDITAQKIQSADYQGQIESISKSQAVIEFDMDGIIQTANENFLSAMGYSLDEIKGQHHKMFVEPAEATSVEYQQFWKSLGDGTYMSGEYKRLGKGGKEVWIQASYNPILDMNGKPFKVVKYASEVTEQKLRNADYQGQIEAIGKSQAVIEFNMDGIIQHANDNFLSAMGYRLEEIQGKHHSIFVETEYKNSHEYTEFWNELKRGIFSTGEYKRIAKDGSEVWIQASYNPIMDLNGDPIKVVKYATDITGRKVAVNEVKNTLLRLSQGDLTCKIEREFDGEFIELKNAINDFIEELNNMISEIRNATTTINGASNEISQGNSDLSARTEQQASSLEETASSMEELTGTVRLNAENAGQANGLASQAADVAKNGGELIGRVVDTMSSINESAKKISDIIGVIDGIAFQTNILALNAAVEAARAGEQGRGFAVVASEVRTLAQRSANAAKDIKELISDSVEKVESGNALVNQSGETMQEIVTSIQRVNDIMSEIAAASNEQASGIDEVGKAVTQMDEMTQQNAALVEEAAAAAESLKSQADQLAQRVNTFQLDPGLINSEIVSLPNRGLPESRRDQGTQPIVKEARVLPASPEEDEWESF